ncbi:MAG: hypothetical protein KDD62_13770, partial [Bdellovibrionales bacterium]|nr:hypothetical protein [Bdellovibrionales bacterium]
TGAIYFLKGKKHSSKGAVVTGTDLNKMQKSFKLFSIVYPVIAFFVALDRFLPFAHGNMLIVKARCLK